MSKNKQKETFKVDDTEFAVLEPKPAQGREAQKSYNAAFATALASGALLRQRVNTYMSDQGLWDDEKEAEQKVLLDKLNDCELKLQKGGIKLTEARELAIDMRRVRHELRTLLTKKNELDITTAEGQAENARFNALVAQCLVYNESGEPVYKDVDSYLEHSDEEQAFTGAQTLAQMLYQLDKNHEVSLPENKFLSHWKFVNEDLRLINKDGHLIDTDGRLINEDGYYITKDGTLVDIQGNPVDAEGNYVVEQAPFLDDSGKPLGELPGEQDKKKTVAKKAPRAAKKAPSATVS